MKSVIKNRLVLPVILCLVVIVGIIIPSVFTPDVGAGEPDIVSTVIGGLPVAMGLPATQITSAMYLVPDTEAYDPYAISIAIDDLHVMMSSPVTLINATAYVPIYDFSIAMGAESIYNRGYYAVVTAPGLRVYATAGNPYIVANGRYLHVPHLNREIDGMLHVPIRPLAKAFGASVRWLYDIRGVTVTNTGVPIESGSSFYDETDLFWMSRIISAEARGESLKGQIAVGNVVMNRTRSPMYPDTVRGVIFDRRHGIQFTPAHSGAINRAPTQSSVIAAKLALDGADVIGDSLFFSSTSIRCWASRNRPFATTIGNHNFFG